MKKESGPPGENRQSFEGAVKMEGVSKKPIKLHPFIPLTGLAEPICGTESRLVIPHSVTLRIRRDGLGCSASTLADRFTITCANSGADYFRCVEKMSLSCKKVLWDVAGNPVLNMKIEDVSIPWTFISPTLKWSVFAGTNSEKPLLKIKVKWSFFRRNRVTADFLDVCNGRRRHLALEWASGERFAVIYSGMPELDGVPIAKFYSSSGSCNNYLEVAPDVDVALMVAMCIAAVE